MFSSPDNERTLTGAAKIFAEAEKQLEIAKDFYEEALLPTLRKEGLELTPAHLRELISSYEKENPEKKVNRIALENVAAASIARGKGSSFELRKQAGKIIQKTFDVPPATFQWKIRIWKISTTGLD